MTSKHATYTHDVADDIGDLMAIEEWIEDCEDGCFIDDDGYAHPVRDGKFDPSLNLHPSDRENRPKDATHVLWYNR